MFPRARQYRLRGYPWTGFRYRGKRYGLRRGQWRELRFLDRLVRSVSSGPHDVYWLLRFRPDFRRLIANRPLALLAHLAASTRSVAMCRLTIWLLGRCGSSFGISAVAQPIRHDDVTLRREVARALQRMHAWSELREMEAGETDQRVLALATQSRPVPHADRLTIFLGDVTPRVVQHTHTQLTCDARILTRTGRPPKAASWIRRVLQRIHGLVRDQGG